MQAGSSSRTVTHTDAMSAPAVAVRRQLWAQFVRRALAHVHTTRGWSIPQVAHQAGISDPTIYRWRDGKGVRLPLPEQVLAFCDALDIDPAVAFRVLWPGKDERPTEPEPPPLPDEMVAIARKLEDPNVSEAEKYLLRETLRQLAARPSRPGATPEGRRRAG